jgi:CheY-like chemotaxis protein
MSRRVHGWGKCMGSAFPLTGRSILVVEDEPLISLEMTALFESVGAKVLQARTVAEALERADAVSAAVLDYSLAKSNPALYGLLKERSIPFMFYTGYGDVQEDHPHAVVVQKPATSNALLTAVVGLVEPGAVAGSLAA